MLGQNYSRKLLKTNTDHLSMMTKHGVTASGLSTVEISYGRDDIKVSRSESRQVSDNLTVQWSEAE